MLANSSSDGQIYVEGLPLKKPDTKHGIFGFWSIEDMVNQPGPRLFSTHLPARMLPRKLKERGRMVYVLRNPKDAMTSLHFFLGVAKDDWLGNEHGPGSFNRFLAKDCPNAFGSFFDYVEEMDRFITEIGEGRAIVVYYEDMKADLAKEVRRIGAFLQGGVPISDAKTEAAVHRASLDTMKAAAEKAGGIAKFTIRKGVGGDWKNHLTLEKWKEVDAVFEERLGHVGIAQPLRKWLA